MFKEQTLISFFKKKNLTIETEIIKSDKLIDFDDYFKAYDFLYENGNQLQVSSVNNRNG